MAKTMETTVKYRDPFLHFLFTCSKLKPESNESDGVKGKFSLCASVEAAVK